MPMQSRKRSWPAKTDLRRLKGLAQTFLMLDIQPTKMSPIAVSHPYTDSGFVGLRGEDGSMGIGNLMDDPNALQKWQTALRQQIREAKSPVDLFMLITKPYKLGFFKHAAPLLSEQDAALFLSQSWIISEAPNLDPNWSKRELVSLFRAIDPQKLMNDEEYTLFQGLDNVVTIYRGVTSYNAKNIKAMSWTLNRDTAEWFAHRFGEDGTVYEAQIEKKHIYAIFTGRNESEVIIDPKYLLNLSQAIEHTRGFEMTM